MKPSLNLRKIWTISLVLYIICSSAFSYGSLKMLNTWALYFFLGVSAVNILFNLRMKLNFALISIILYMVIVWVGVFYSSTSQSGALEVLYKYITMAVVTVCVVQYIDSVADVETVMRAYMLAGLVLAVYVYSLYGNSFWTIMQQAADTENGYVVRLGDELTNVNTIGMYTIISTLIALYNVIFNRTSKLKTLGCIVLAVFCFVVAMASASKKSVILLLLGIVCMWVYHSLGTKNLKKNMRSMLFALGGTIVLIYIINTLPIFSGIATRFQDMFDVAQNGSGGSDAGRINMIGTGLRVWMEHPLFGAGTKASYSTFGTYSHNNFVEILMNSGFVGFTVFYLVYLYAAYKYLHCAVQLKEKSKLPILLFALFMAITVCGVGLVYYYSRYYMILLTVVFSAIGVLEKEPEKPASTQA